jgi:hypothetical protein
MKIDYKKIYNDTEYYFNNEKDLFCFINHYLDFLVMHNKNLTNAQYNKICVIQNILKCFEIE